MVEVPFLRAYLGGFLGFWKPLKFWLAIETTIDHHSGIYVSINQQTILCLAAYIHAVTGQGVARHLERETCITTQRRACIAKPYQDRNTF